jgi:hypothetical protein
MDTVDSTTAASAAAAAGEAAEEGGLTAADISLSSGTGPTLNIYANLITDFFSHSLIHSSFDSWM